MLVRKDYMRASKAMQHRVNKTGGHVFQLLFTNSQSSNEPGFMSSAEGDMVFGFNVVRVF